MEGTFSVIARTLLWASGSTLLVLIPATALAYLLARKEFPGKHLIATLCTLPLVLPPTAVGYLLLLLLADNGLLGVNRIGFDLQILFTWKAVILASAVMSFPLVVRTARLSFANVDPRLETMSRSLGYGWGQTMFKVTLPLAYRGLLAAAILGFTRALGEFGATVMIAGNLGGRTSTLSASIYSAQQSGDRSHAHLLVALALLIGFAAVFASERFAPKDKSLS